MLFKWNFRLDNDDEQTRHETYLKVKTVPVEYTNIGLKGNWLYIEFELYIVKTLHQSYIGHNIKIKNNLKTLMK